MYCGGGEMSKPKSYVMTMEILVNEKILYIISAYFSRSERSEEDKNNFIMNQHRNNGKKWRVYNNRGFLSQWMVLKGSKIVTIEVNRTKKVKRF